MHACFIFISIKYIKLTAKFIPYFINMLLSNFDGKSFIFTQYKMLIYIYILVYNKLIAIIFKLPPTFKIIFYEFLHKKQYKSHKLLRI